MLLFIQFSILIVIKQKQKNPISEDWLNVFGDFG